MHAMRGEARHGPHHHGFGPRESRDRRSTFEGAELRLVILLLIENAPSHGYDLIRTIESRTGGAYAPSPEIIYPTLMLLEEVGQVEVVASADAKKLYALTGAGRTHLAQNRQAADAALARLDRLGQKSEAFAASPVLRAMSNLEAVLQGRLSRAGDRTFMLSVADVIDEAARKIERL